MERRPQTLANHGKFDPLYHFVLAPMALLMLLGGIWAVIRNPGWEALRYLALSLWLFLVLYRVRSYPLKMQDRIIRVEERLRLSNLLPEALRARIPEIREEQLIALRFASDAETPELVRRALDEKLPPNEIKKSIRNWRPDYYRL